MNGTTSQKRKLQNLGLAQARKFSSSGKGVRSQLIDDTDKILLPPLHTEFGLMKNFVKTMNK